MGVSSRAWKAAAAFFLTVALIAACGEGQPMERLEGLELRGSVVEVDASARTVTLSGEDRTQVTFLVREDTQFIAPGGGDGALDSVQVGQDAAVRGELTLSGPVAAVIVLEPETQPRSLAELLATPTPVLPELPAVVADDDAVDGLLVDVAFDSRVLYLRRADGLAQVSVQQAIPIFDPNGSFIAWSDLRPGDRLHVRGRLSRDGRQMVATRVDVTEFGPRPGAPSDARPRPLLALDPPDGRLGQKIIAWGLGWPPESTVELFVLPPDQEQPGVPLQVGNTNENGRLFIELNLPLTWGDGAPILQRILAVGARVAGENRLVTAPFQVISGPVQRSDWLPLTSPVGWTLEHPPDWEIVDVGDGSIAFAPPGMEDDVLFGVFNWGNKLQTRLVEEIREQFDALSIRTEDVVVSGRAGSLLRVEAGDGTVSWHLLIMTLDQQLLEVALRNPADPIQLTMLHTFRILDRTPPGEGVVYESPEGWQITFPSGWEVREDPDSGRIFAASDFEKVRFGDGVPFPEVPRHESLIVMRTARVAIQPEFDAIADDVLQPIELEDGTVVRPQVQQEMTGAVAGLPASRRELLVGDKRVIQLFVDLGGRRILFLTAYGDLLPFNQIARSVHTE